MENQVIIRDRQEGQAQDINNLQAFVDKSLQHIVMESITGERMFVGLLVTMTTATEIEVAAGALWDGPTGRIFRKEEAERTSVFAHLPIQDERWLAVSVSGQEVEVDIQPRDFLIDLDTGQTEPRAVAMEMQRQVITHITAGIESADPQKPEAPTNYVVIAYVRMDINGIVEIELAENTKLMRLFEVWQQTLANLEWINEAAPKIEALVSDLANLGERLSAIKEPLNINELAADVALLKDLAELPDTYSSYGGDVFLDPDESDTANAEYYARVDEGIRMPWAGQTEQQPALFNPYDASVTNLDGLILPKYSHVRRLRTSGKSGELIPSQFPYETQQMKQGTRTKTRVRYGPTRVVCTNNRNWQKDITNFVTNVFEGPATGYEKLGELGYHGNHYYIRYRQYWKDTITEPYWYVETIDHTINGSQVAQTFMAPSSGWLTGIALAFTKPATTGTVYVHLCETALGVVDREKCLATAQVEPSGLKKYSTRTFFEFPQPVYVVAGRRYGFTVTTAGPHELALVAGTAFANGTLFYSTDGAYYEGDLTKDLMFDLYYARFEANRTTVELEPIDLSEGIADFDMLLEQVAPQSTDLVFQYKKSGDNNWYTITDGTADQLLGLPALCHLRAVFVGSRDVQPALALSGSRIQANRPATNFRHISTERTLAAASEDIDVIVLLEGWDDTKHTCTCKLVNGGTEYSPTGTVDLQIDAASIKRTFTFTPEAGTGITAYQIKLEGTTTTALDCFHVASRMDVAK